MTGMETLTPTLSQREREPESILTWHPLPLGEGWGEGDGTHGRWISRGNILLHALPNLRAVERADKAAHLQLLAILYRGHTQVVGFTVFGV